MPFFRPSFRRSTYRSRFFRRAMFRKAKAGSSRTTFGRGGMKSITKPPPFATTQRRGGTGAMLLGPRNVFPTQGIFKEFTYGDTFNLSSTTSLASSGTGNYYYMGGLYGPLLSGAGTSHQPYEWDQVSGIYKYFQVYEFGWNIEFCDPSTSSCWGVISVNPSGDANYSVSTMLARNAIERYGTQYFTLTSTGERRTVMTGRVKLWEVDGFKYQAWLANPNFIGTNSSNPTLSPVLGMAIGDHASPIGTSSVRVSIKLTFKAKLFSAVTQSAS